MAKKLSNSTERITDEILIKAIACDLSVNEKEIKVKNWEWDQGARPGENFVTDVYAVEIKAVIDGQEKEFKYAIKTKAVDGFKTIFEKYSLFSRECQFYNNILPKLVSFRKEANLPPLKMVRTFYASDEDGLIVMENLKAQGFDTFNQNSVDGLSIECVEAVMMNVAQYHATSYHYVQTYPGGEERFIKDHPWFATASQERAGLKESGGVLDHFIGCKFPPINEIVKKFSNLGEELDRQFENWQEKVVTARDYPASSFALVCHGDTKTANMLFRMNEDGAVIDFALIDFQVLSKASPILDLSYFLYGSVHPDLLRIHQEHFLKLYHETLIHDLTWFGYPKDIFTFDNIKEDWKSTQYNGYAFGLGHLANAIRDYYEPSNDSKKDEVVKKIISYVEFAKEQGI